MAKQDEVEPADESESTAGGGASEERTGSSTASSAARAPADSGEPGGTPEVPVVAGPSPDDEDPDEFDEIVRNSGVGEDSEDDEAKVLEPAGVAASTTRAGSSALTPARSPRTPKADSSDKRDRLAKPERTTPLKFVRQSVGELRKVVYPTGQQLVNYFVVVLVFVLFVIAYVSLLDLGFGAAIFRIFS